MLKFQINFRRNLDPIFLSKKINSKIRTYGFCVLKNFNDLKTQSKILEIIKKKSKKYKNIRLSGTNRLFNNDYKRTDLGNSYKNPRFMRILTFFEWQKENKLFFSLINKAINLRNSLSSNKKINYFYPNAKPIGKKRIGRNFVYSDFVRMIQYPKGGGFLSEHEDYDKYYCKDSMGMLLPITVKSKENKINKKKLEGYRDGGLYFVNNCKKKILIDDSIQSGDIIFFNPKIRHGVMSIDPYENIELNKISGRITLAFSVSRFLKK